MAAATICASNTAGIISRTGRFRRMSKGVSMVPYPTPTAASRNAAEKLRTTNNTIKRRPSIVFHRPFGFILIGQLFSGDFIYSRSFVTPETVCRSIKG